MRLVAINKQNFQTSVSQVNNSRGGGSVLNHSRKLVLSIHLDSDRQYFVLGGPPRMWGGPPGTKFTPKPRSWYNLMILFSSSSIRKVGFPVPILVHLPIKWSWMVLWGTSNLSSAFFRLSFELSTAFSCCHSVISFFHLSEPSYTLTN